MKRLGYFEKLSLAARWFLPNEEAESMVEDYKDILNEVRGPEEALEHFGPPWKAVMELADRKKVRRWHMFFIMMAFCAVVPAVFLFIQYATGNYFYMMEKVSGTFVFLALYMFGLDIILGGSNSKTMTWISIAVLTAVEVIVFSLGPMEVLDSILLNPIKETFLGGWFPTRTYTEYYMVIGGVLALIYFRFGKKLKRPISKPLIFSLMAAVLAVASLYGFVMFCFHVDFGPMLHIFRLRILSDVMAVLFLIGAIAGIVMARMVDSRWRSLYIICIMGIVLCFETHNLFWNMGPSLWVFVDGYNSGVVPDADWVHKVTFYFTKDIAIGTVMAAVGLL